MTDLTEKLLKWGKSPVKTFDDGVTPPPWNPYDAPEETMMYVIVMKKLREYGYELSEIKKS